MIISFLLQSQARRERSRSNYFYESVYLLSISTDDLPPDDTTYERMSLIRDAVYDYFGGGFYSRSGIPIAVDMLIGRWTMTLITNKALPVEMQLSFEPFERNGQKVLKATPV